MRTNSKQLNDERYIMKMNFSTNVKSFAFSPQRYHTGNNQSLEPARLRVLIAPVFGTTLNEQSLKLLAWPSPHR